MMLTPTSGRQGFGYVKEPIDKKVTSSDQQDVNKTMTNISNEVNGEQQQKVVQQTTDAIKKGKN